MSKQTVTIPDLGGASDVEVIELCVTNGDVVSEGQSLIVVESDKASMEVPSPAAGKIISIEVSEGSSVSEGDVILELEAEGAEPSAVNAEPSAVNAEPSAVNAEPSAMNAEPSAMNAEPSAMNAEPSAVNAEPSAVTAQPSASAAEATDAATPAEKAKPAEATAPAAASAAQATTVERVPVPDLGGADAVELIEILVAPGDTVAEGDGLMVMESDKASMELPSPVAGVVKALHVESGASLAVGDIVAEIEVQGGAAAVTKAAPAAANKTPAAKETAAPQAAAAPAADKPAPAAAASSQAATSKPGTDKPATEKSGKTIYAGPAVRKLARELSVDLARVKGSGPKSRIAKPDLYNFVKQLVEQNSAGGSTGGAGIPALPEVDFSQFGEIEIEKMSRLHKLTAANMHRSWLNVPHVTQYDDADITELEVFRKSLKPQMEKRGVKISPLPFILKAVAAALQQHPSFNVSLSNDGQSIIRKKYIHIGLAVDTPAGLVVPVIRDVDKKGIWELSQEIIEMAGKARDRKLQAADMQGGCFTISSLGGIGGLGFTPIINTPEVGILGVSRLSTKPVFVDGAFVPRQMLPLSLSYDHRAVNGGDAGRFLTFLASLLGDVRQLVL